jgi:hypothetical protein
MGFHWTECARLRSGGGFHVAVFWFRILVGLISLVFGIYSIVLISMTASKIWVKVIGSSLLVSSIILLLSSIAVFAFLFIVSFGLDFCKSLPNCGFQLLIVSSLFSHIASCVYIALSTEASAESCVARLSDFCLANPADELVVEFINGHPTPFSLRSFVYQRTTDQLGTIVAFFAIWVGGDCALVLCTACGGTHGGGPTSGSPQSSVPLDRSGQGRTGLSQDEDAVDVGRDEADDPEWPADDQPSPRGEPTAVQSPPSRDRSHEPSEPVRGRNRRRYRRAYSEDEVPPDSRDAPDSDA